MEPTTKSAADRVNKHREDGEEAMKRTSNVVPIDAGKRGESVRSTTNARRESEDNHREDTGNK